MSALNVVKLRDRVIVVTDAASYSADSGIVMGFGVKQATLPHLPAVIGVRGAPLAVAQYAHFLGFRVQSFDALVAGIEAALPDVTRQVQRLCAAHDGRRGVDEPIDIAGWSRARNRPESYTIAVSANPVFSLKTLEDEKPESMARAIQSEPYNLYPLKGIMYGPLVSDEACEASGILNVSQLSEAEQWRAMIRLLQAQRRNF